MDLCRFKASLVYLGSSMTDPGNRDRLHHHHSLTHSHRIQDARQKIQQAVNWGHFLTLLLAAWPWSDVVEESQTGR